MNDQEHVIEMPPHPYDYAKPVTGGVVPKQVRNPTTRPDAGAQEIIDMIERYASSDRSPLAVVGGLLHVLLASERVWDASVARAKGETDPQTGRPYTYRQLTEATDGLAQATLQGRIKFHNRRQRARGLGRRA